MFLALFFLANVLFCLAYIVRDMAWLRAITILAASCTLPYFYFQPSPLYSVMGWQIAFIVINGVNLTPREMLRVLALARWERSAPGARLIEQGTDPEELLLIYDGLAEVRVDDHFRANLGPGDVVGEMSFATGRPTSADVEVPSNALKPLTHLTWRRQDLRQLFRRQPGIKDALQTVLGVDMAQKLSR